MAATNPGGEKTRRILRFSLRTLLLIVLVVGMALAWRTNRARNQRAAVEWIRKMGGFIRYDYELNDSGRRLENPETPVPPWLTRSLGIDFFAEVVKVDFELDES